jgi:tetratricopeptide (TPR) repeat protein
MDKLPAAIELENKSLLHFFSARKLEALGSQDTERIICEYSKAIELSPNFAAAYNNLGILATKVIIGYQAQPNENDEGFQFPGKSRDCLSKIGFTENDMASDDIQSFFFDKALSTQPDSAVIKYNIMASAWRLQHADSQTDEDYILNKIEDILRKDPTIPGAHVMRGVLAFKKSDAAFNDSQYQTALREFSTASTLMPGRAELHVNIGKVYLRKGRHAEARAEFEKALSFAPNSAEARLALADAAIRQGQSDFALKQLNAVNSDRIEDKSAVRMAAVLKSLVYFRAGNTAAAIEALQTNLSQQPEQTPTPGEGSASQEPEGGSPAAEVSENDASLVHYLLGIFYTSNSDQGAAREHFRKCHVPEIGGGERGRIAAYAEGIEEAYHNNETANVVWYEMLSLCVSGGLDTSKWGVTSQCLPRDTSQRLSKVFGAAQSWIAHRIFYRMALFSGLRCPYVFSYDAGRGQWLFDTTIIYGLNRRELESLQPRPLSRFDGRLLVREVEPEISHLDQISVVVVDRLGESHVLRPQIKALRAADNQYLILHRGDEVLLTFEGFEQVKEPLHFRIDARGYYLPMKHSRAIR